MSRLPLILLTAANLAAAELTMLSVPRASDYVPYRIRMTDQLHGWSRTEAAFFGTEDGGRTWMKEAATGTLGPSWGVTTDGAVWGLIPGRSELIRMSAQGSVDHFPIPCANGCYPASIGFDPAGRTGLLWGLVPLADPYTSQIVLFRTTDGGRTWARLPEPNVKVYRDDFSADLAAPNTALMASSCDLFTTADSGESWMRSPQEGTIRAILCSENATPFSIRFTSAKNGWLRTNDGWILHTNDAGASWVVAFGKQAAYASTLDEWISFANELDGLVFVKDRVLATTDGGTTWTPVSGLENGFWSVSCAVDRCVLVSEHRVLQYTFDEEGAK